MNKKYLPFIILGIGIVVFLGIVFMIRRGQGGNETANNEETVVAELPADQKPTAELLPSMDGHWLKMKITDISKVKDAASMDYEVIYKVASGQTQGVPGNIPLGGQSTIERDLLLGSESSGKFRYDVGVNAGTLTLRFRNSSGKLLGKLATDFTLTSSGKTWSVTMDSFSGGQKTFTSTSDFMTGKP